MEHKPSSHPAKTGPKAVGKRPKAVSETARLFLDVDELNRRSQHAPTSRYVE